MVKKAQPALGTIVEITVADKDKPRPFLNAAIELAFAEIERVEHLLSRFNPESDISRINAYACLKPTEVSPETIRLIEESIKFSRITQGAFDITVCPLMQAWGFEEKYKRHPPDLEQIKEALDKVGYRNINILKQEQSVFLAQPAMSLDLGGIAKGYAVDKAIAVLRQEGIKNALVNAGGDIYALGVRGKNRKWRVAVQHPRKNQAVLAMLELEDKAVATSGDYQKYIEISGRRYSHIINPESGNPCSEVPASVTVLAGDCLAADALATSIFVLGPKKGIDLVNRLENTEAIVAAFPQDKLGISLSQGLKGKLKVTP
ncbi:MAG: FAD:protein FMN transferase [Candidatus Omnitrophica bacterium]|nr:FAD:protein FMN transferase [Candidatus Omnitrophota bacterium]